MHLADAALDGQRRAIGQPRLERAPDPLDGVASWAGARPEGQVHRAKDRPSPVLARGHDLLALPVRDPGGAHPRQQVHVGLVLGQHHRPRGQLGKLGAAQAWPSRSGPVDRPGHPVLVVAVDPAAHRGRIAAHQLGDGDRGPAAMDSKIMTGGPRRGGGDTADRSPRRAASGAGEVGVHTGGTRTGGGLVGSVGCEGFSDPRGYFIARSSTAGYEQNLRLSS